MNGKPGAMITDLPHDFTAASSAELDQVRAAYGEYGLVVFRGRELAIEEQLAICASLGTIVEQAGAGRSWFNITNQGGGYDGKLCFHADFSNTDHLLTGASLYASALPDGPTATLFAHTGWALEALPATVRSRIRGARAVHSNMENTPATPATPVRHAPALAMDPRAEHPIEFAHPGTGRSFLFVSDLQTERIVGMGEQNSLALLDELTGWVQQARFVYRHQWQLHDLVVWDQIMMQHSREAESVHGERTLRRVSFTHPMYAEGCQSFFASLGDSGGRSGKQEQVL